MTEINPVFCSGASSALAGTRSSYHSDSAPDRNFRTEINQVSLLGEWGWCRQGQHQRLHRPWLNEIILKVENLRGTWGKGRPWLVVFFLPPPVPLGRTTENPEKTRLTLAGNSSWTEFCFCWSCPFQSLMVPPVGAAPSPLSPSHHHLNCGFPVQPMAK